MIIRFSINYQTQFGQNLYISGSLPELGGGDMGKAILMEYHEDSTWIKDIKITSFEERVFSYRYFVKNADGHIIMEAGFDRKLALNSSTKHLFLNDEWHGRNAASIFLTAPFSKVFVSESHTESTQMRLFKKELIIRTIVPTVGKNIPVRICGNHPLLGAWDPARSVAMKPVHGSGWELHLPQDKIGNSLQFKFIKTHPDTGSVIWEDGPNRILNIPCLNEEETCLAEFSEGWFEPCKPEFYGTTIPVFSLRTGQSCGIGDFSDLKLFGDWIKKTGQHFIQILPVNDTTATGTWTDSYPYSVISVMALNPVYLNIEAIGPIKDFRKRAEYEQRKQSLNSLKYIDYEAVLRLKQEFSEIQFNDYSEENFSEPDYYVFYKKNREWLLPYCAFCCLRDKYGTADFSRWGNDAKFTSGIADSFMKSGSPMRKSMEMVMFVQYHLHRQLSDSVAYLHSIGIALKGDIPIGISPHSVEAWTEPQYFNMDCQAGAPPDDFSENGQNWGFPTYNWDRMEADGYRWWKKRLHKMEEYFDAYRIDHILGFFRIWEIPAVHGKSTMGHFSPALPMSCGEIHKFGFHFNRGRHATPYIKYGQLNGLPGEKSDEAIYNSADDGESLFLEDENRKGMFHPCIAARKTDAYKTLSREEQRAFDAIYEHFFYHRHNDLWKAEAYRKLPEILSASNMLACAEDLGMVPACVPEVMSALHILSLEIFRMPKTPGRQFQNPKDYPYLSVSTTGTHDMDTLRGWWEETYKKPCEPSDCEKIIRDHICGNSMLTILPLQDWLSIDGSLRAKNPADERINIPSNPRHYWKYRMHLTIEQLLEEETLNTKLNDLFTTNEHIHENNL